MVWHLRNQYNPYRPALSDNIVTCNYVSAIITRIQCNPVPSVAQPDAPLSLSFSFQLLKMKGGKIGNIKQEIRSLYEVLRSLQFYLYLFRISPAFLVLWTELFSILVLLYVICMPEKLFPCKKHYLSSNITPIRYPQACKKKYNPTILKSRSSAFPRN